MRNVTQIEQIEKKRLRFRKRGLPQIFSWCLVMIISGLGFSTSAAYSIPIVPLPQSSESSRIAQAVDLDLDNNDQDNDRDDNEPRQSQRRTNVASKGCGASVQVGRISLASCLANRSAASALRTFTRSNRSNCRNSVSQSSTQSTTVNGVTRRISQSNSTCQ